MFKCECNREFTTPQGLGYHKKYCKKQNKCLICGKETTNDKYCSLDCSYKGRVKPRIIQLKTKNGSYNAQRKRLKKYYEKKYKKIMESLPFEKWPIKLIKRTLFKEANNKCSECSYDYIDSKTGKGPYQIHHIDGNNKNWKKENLKILCLNCHWKTPNFAFKNRKHTIKTKEKLSEMSTNQINRIGFHEKYKDVL